MCICLHKKYIPCILTDLKLMGLYCPLLLLDKLTFANIKLVFPVFLTVPLKMAEAAV